MLIGNSVFAVVLTPKAGGQRGKAGRKINKIRAERELLSACVLSLFPSEDFTAKEQFICGVPSRV